MITAIGVTAIALSVLMSNADAEFIARVEKTELVDGQGKAYPRVERDAEGNIERLALSGMQLSADDFAAIGRTKTLRFLSLHKTNVTDKDLRKVCELPNLRGLNLTSTEVTDAAIDEIVKLKSLRSVCLGDVAVTPEAVARLKEHFRTPERQLSLGYFRRK